MLFDMFKAFVKSEGSQKLDFLFSKNISVLHACATCSELPSNVSTRNMCVMASLILN